MRFQARLGHQMVKAKHLTGEDVERAWGVSWRRLNLYVGEERCEVT